MIAQTFKVTIERTLNPSRPDALPDERIDFLEPVVEFLGRAARVELLTSSVFELEGLPAGSSPPMVVPAVP